MPQKYKPTGRLPGRTARTVGNLTLRQLFDMGAVVVGEDQRPAIMVLENPTEHVENGDAPKFRMVRFCDLEGISDRAERDLLRLWEVEEQKERARAERMARADERFCKA